MRTRAATGLAVLALLTAVGAVPSAAQVVPLVPSPVVAVEGGRAVAGPGAVLTVSGTSPDATLVDARVVGYEAGGGTVEQPLEPGTLGAAPGPGREHLRLLRGALDGRVVLGCAFDVAPGPAAHQPRTCTPHGPVRWLALELTVRVDGVSQTVVSPRLAVDVAPPRVQAVEVVRRDELRVVFDEPVQNAGERPAEWAVVHAGARYPVRTVALADPGDCAEVERRCARRLELAAALPDGATPQVTWSPGAADSAYTDLAGNTHVPGLHTAADVVRPPRPRITAVDGVPVTGPRPSRTSARRQPVLTVTGVPAGATVLVRATPDRGPVTESSPVRSTDAAATLSATSPVLPSGPAVLEAVVVDPAGNRSTDAGEPSTPDQGPATVDHLLDDVAPQPVGGAVREQRTVVVTFSEPVLGAVDLADWRLTDGDRVLPWAASEAAPSLRCRRRRRRDDGPVRTFLAADPVPDSAVLTYTPADGRRLRDAAGGASPSAVVPVHGLAAPVLDVPAVPEVVAALTHVLSGTARTGSTVEAYGPDADRDGAPDLLTAVTASPAFTFVLPLAPDARHDVVLRARDPDRAGVVSPALVLPPVVQDSTEPALTTTGPAEGSSLVAGSVQPLVLGYSDLHPAAAELAVSLDDGPLVPLPPASTSGPTSWTVPRTASERAVLQVTALDAAGRRTVVRSAPFRVDAAPPALQATTLDASTVAVRLSEPVQGASTAADWQVDRERVTALTERLEDGLLVVRLALRTPKGPDARPLVTYLGRSGSAYRDGAGQQVAQTEVQATDGVLPAAPTVLVPASAQLTTAEQVQVEGRAAAGELVELVDPLERPVARTRATGAGTWSALVPLVRDATHSLRAQTRDASGGRSLTAVAVPSVGQDASDPVVSVLEPGAGSRLEAGQRVTVRWTSTDRHLVDGTTGVQASVDGGRSWTTVGVQQRAAGTLVWTVPATTTPDALLRVTTSDRAGRAGTGTSGALGIGVAAATPAPTSTPRTTASSGATSSPGPTSSATPRPSSATPTATAGASGTARPVARPTSPARPTRAPAVPRPVAPVGPERGLSVVLDRTSTTPGEAATVLVRGTPGTLVELLAYSRPSTEYAVVREGAVGDDGRATFAVKPGTNTRLYARVQDGDDATASRSVVLQVRTALSLSVVRNGRRDYVFQGRVLPRRSGLLVTLYRIGGDSTPVIAKQVRTDAGGTYRVRRTFTGSGSFGFLTRIGANLTNAAGESDEGRTREVRVR